MICSAGLSTWSHVSDRRAQRGHEQTEREDREEEPIGDLRAEPRDVVLPDAGDQPTPDAH